MWSPKRTTTVVLALLLATSGCLGAVTGDGGDGGDGDADGPAGRIQKQSVAAMQDVDTYRMTMEMSTSGAGQSVTIEMDGAFDRADQKARMNMTLRGEDVTVYVDGSTMYLRADGQWRTREMAEDRWNATSRLGQQRKILKQVDATLVGNDTVDGEAVYVLEMQPTGEQVRELLELQGQSIGAADIEDVTLTQYVDKETHRLRRTEIEMTASRGDQSVTVEGVITFSDYGGNVSITVPEEAKQSGTAQAVAGR